MTSLGKEIQENLSHYLSNVDNLALESDEAAQLLEIQIEVSDEITLEEAK